LQIYSTIKNIFKQIKYIYILDHCRFFTKVKLFKIIQLKTYLVVNSIKYFSHTILNTNKWFKPTNLVFIINITKEIRKLAI